MPGKIIWSSFQQKASSIFGSFRFIRELVKNIFWSLTKVYIFQDIFHWGVRDFRAYHHGSTSTRRFKCLKMNIVFFENEIIKLIHLSLLLIWLRPNIFIDLLFADAFQYPFPKNVWQFIMMISKEKYLLSWGSTFKIFKQTQLFLKFRFDKWHV